jgi:hypothetical protein
MRNVRNQASLPDLNGGRRWVARAWDARFAAETRWRHSVFLAIALALFAHPASADVVNGTYTGSAKTNVKYLDPGSLQVIAAESYTNKVSLNITSPIRNGTVTEANPFSLLLAPFSRGNGPTAGEIFAASARIFAVNGGNVLLQYWELDNTNAGFVGFLTNNHAVDGVARDGVVALLGGPGGTPKRFLMHDASIGAGLQCTMSATTTARQLALKIAGYAFVPGKAIIRFNTKIDARRPR